MSDENLGQVLDESYRAHQRSVAIKNLGNRTHLTLGQMSDLCKHPEHGEVVASITLQDLVDIALEAAAHENETVPPRATTKKTKKATKKTAKKATKKTAKKKTAKKATKKTAKKKTARKGDKADKGRPKPRLDYDKGMREVLACLKAAREPVGRSAIEQATGFTGVQVRAFAKKLRDAGKINILGDGGRSTKYVAA